MEDWKKKKEQNPVEWDAPAECTMREEMLEVEPCKILCMLCGHFAHQRREVSEVQCGVVAAGIGFVSGKEEDGSGTCASNKKRESMGNKLLEQKKRNGQVWWKHTMARKVKWKERVLQSLNPFRDEVKLCSEVP